MKISDRQIASLLQMIAQTCDDETSCQDCFEKLAEFAETRLAGENLNDAMAAIDDHLTRCGECREEFEALQEALRAGPG